MKVEVWLKETSWPLVFDAKQTYEKGSYTCIHDAVDGLVKKFPTQDIFRVVEDYGYHGGEAPVENWREE